MLMLTQCPVCRTMTNVRIRQVQVQVQVNRLTQSPVQIWKCGECQFVFCHPLPCLDSPSSGEYSVMTAEDYTAGLLTIPESKQRQYDVLAENRYWRYSSRLQKRDFRLLEIGCGSCGLARRYQQLGVDYNGIDLDSRVVEAARSAGVKNVRQGDFIQERFDQHFDVIVFSQVLEHIKTPVQFLTKVHSLLQVGGVVHCDVPNQDSLPSLIHRLPLTPVRWGAITYPNHLFAYNRHSLKSLFGRFFSIEVFDAVVTDPTWGQATNLSSALARLGPLLHLIHAGSLLVVVGSKYSSLAKC